MSRYILSLFFSAHYCYVFQPYTNMVKALQKDIISCIFTGNMLLLQKLHFLLFGFSIVLPVCSNILVGNKARTRHLGQLSNILNRMHCGIHFIHAQTAEIVLTHCPSFFHVNKCVEKFY